MHREIINQLINWKKQAKRKPVLLDGARQTGKTYLLTKLFAKYFTNYVHLDFLRSSDLADVFAESLDPDEILNKLELFTGQTINTKNTLIIFDEIGECHRAVLSLKYFAENRQDIYLVASGSNIGLLDKYPVGKVHQLKMHPLSFYEFLLASGEEQIIDAYKKQTKNAVIHKILLDKLSDYYFTGGMPEAVSTWYDDDLGLLEKTNAVIQIQQDLINGYILDFGKYAGKVNAAIIESVFTNIPSQLSAVIDESVNRFKFKGVYEHKSRYTDLSDAISWLEKCSLVLKNFPIDSTPKSPLKAYKRDNFVKLFLFDIGLLNRMLSLSYMELKQQLFEYKGYLAENFVQQEMAAYGICPTFSWQQARSEIEFIVSDNYGDVIPIEVKSGIRTKAKSLASYIAKNKPKFTIKLTATQGTDKDVTDNIVMPLYYVEHMVRNYLLT